MINLEQVKLLETKVAKAVEYVERLAKENIALHRQEEELQARLESNQKRIDELEVLVMGFKEDQGQIEDGILAVLDRLNQFEKAIEKSLRDKAAGAKPAAVSQAAKPPQAAQAAPEAGEGQTCFEIPEAAVAAGAAGDDIPDPLEGSQDKKPPNDGTAPAEGGELDIF